MWAYAAAVAIGAATWLLVAAASGRREAWDSELYFSIALPAIGLSAAILGFLLPHRPWRWGFAPLAGQAAVAFVQNPTAGLLPLGLIVFAIFGALCTVPAYAGVRLKRFLKRGTA
jgi:hypothetical protein